MQTAPLTLVTIIAEAVLKDRLIDDIHNLGAHGHTVGEVDGEGSRGIRASTWQGRNVKIETLVNNEIADKILARLTEHYFDSFAVVAYKTTVEVVRAEKFA